MRQSIEHIAQIALDCRDIDCQHAISAFGQPLAALATRFCGRLALAHGDKINHHAQGEGYEIRDMHPDRYLALETKPGQAAIFCNPVPETTFRISGITPQQP